MADLRHELSWSPSRDRSFNGCKRQYYWQYYGFWGGWAWEAAPERKRAYMLKKMTRMPMLAGSVVHSAIARFYDRRKRGEPVPGPKDLGYWCRDQLREAFGQSLGGGWKDRPNRVEHLAEHHYEEPEVAPRSEALAAYGKRYVDKMKVCIEHFLTADSAAPMRDAPPESWLAVDPIENTFDKSRGFRWQGLHVHAFPDFAWRDTDGGVHIVDWKTGSPSEADNFQLRVYTLVGRELWDTPPDLITTYCVYLADGVHKKTRQTPELQKETIATMEASMEAMKALNYDPDTEPDQRESFPMTEDLNTCKRCNFREICGR